jgi:hypothetical protein
MKKMFTKLLSTAVLIGLLITGATVKAQETFASVATLNKSASTISTAPAKPAADPVDTSFHPVRRLWGYTFGDFYYAAQAPSLTSTVPNTQGKETNYSGVPAGRNAFQFRRVYLGYDYDINKQFSVQLLLAAEPSANNAVATGTTVTNADNLADNKLAFYIKYINLRWKGIFNGTDLVIGQQATPGWSALSETIWGYRSIEKTVADFHKTNSYDLGAALQGTFDPATKDFGYDIMVGNNSQATLSVANNPNTGFFKAFYGDLWAKALDKTLIFQLYADYMQTASTTVGTPLGPQAHNMLKGFVAYNVPAFTIGVEAFTNSFKNGLTDKTSGVNENAKAEAISIFAHAPLVKDKLNVFARYDGYNPDDNSDYNGADAYTINTNFSSYDPNIKETFVTAGLDFTPAKNIHFMPNLWYIGFKDQRDPTNAAYEPSTHLLVYRLTFFFQFGK